ncbi:MAG: hypothetical protein IJV72_00320 [Clostridia bacterium]|nr:hypothetical protein [Clostridia bacterium]
MERIDAIRFQEAEMLRFLSDVPVFLPTDSRIAGYTILNTDEVVPPKYDPEWEISDNLHFSMGTTYLTYGFGGVAERAYANMEGKDDEAKQTLLSVAHVYEGVVAYIKRHIEEIDARIKTASPEELENLAPMRSNLYELAEGAPKTFGAAVQAFYLAWKLRGTLNTATIGRLDQYLYPFYRNDIDSGRLTEDEALDIVCDLWKRFNASGSGDTLMTLTVGGQDKDGRDEANDLSVLMVKASCIVHQPEPHLHVRYHNNTRKDFMDQVARLHVLGGGQGSIYNDEVIIPSMVEAGIPLQYACNYATDGCTELIIDRKSRIRFTNVDSVKCLEYALFNGNPPPLPGPAVTKYWTHRTAAKEWQSSLVPPCESGDISEATDFKEVYDAYCRQFKYQITRKTKRLIGADRYFKERCVTPSFLNGSYDECLESGLDSFRGGLPVDCLMMFSGSLTTVADSLAALKHVVFEKKHYTMREVLDALAANYEGYEAMRRELAAAPKFGNDDDSVDMIAADLAQIFIDTTKEVGDEENTRIWPALLGYLFVQEAHFTGATPDGRRWKEPIAEHFSATPGKAVNGPTALIDSAAKAPLAKAYGTAPVHVTLPRTLVPRNEEGEELMKRLVRVAVKKGFLMLNIGIYDVDAMRKAQKNPEQYADLIVRVWGYSARFIDLSEDMQEHVITRVGTQG